MRARQQRIRLARSAAKSQKVLQHAVDSVREMVAGEGNDVGVQGIKDHMPVYASCGKTVGSVDHLEGNTIKLTRKDIPTDCITTFRLPGWITSTRMFT